MWRNARWAALIAVLALLRPADADGASLCLPRIAGPPVQFEYVMRFVDSLQYAKAASDQTDRAIAELGSRQVKTQAELAGAVTDFMVAIKKGGLDYQCAASLVEPFTDSANDAVQTSAKGAHLAYSQLAEIDRHMLSEMRASLDGPAQPAGAAADRISDLTVRKNQVWKLLPMAAVAVTHAIVVVPDKPSERIGRLYLTEAQRREIASELEKTFGPGVRGGMKAGQSALLGSAAALHGFVSDRQWKSFDTR